MSPDRADSSITLSSAPSIAPSIMWFRHDLRICDNPALMAASQAGRPVAAIYIYDQQSERPLGAASQWWLHHSLAALEQDLSAVGLRLILLRGNPQIIIPSLAQELYKEELSKEEGAGGVFWNRRYDGYGVETDSQIKSALKDDGVQVQSFKANLLFEPWEIKNGSGEYYKVFTPFWRAAQKLGGIEPVFSTPKNIIGFAGRLADEVTLDDLDLLPRQPNWAHGFSQYFTPGSAGAREKLTRFLQDERPEKYDNDRNRPDLFATSRLSAHLAFGEISPRQIWHHTRAKTDKGDKFLSEIGWREFSYSLLFHNPKLARVNFKPAFDKFTWSGDKDKLRAWQRGQTGYPFIDAGMRELWATGWQHNRVRMVTASFLIKHLRIDWREGERWFWDTLVDADPASNAASWQWVAGSGADAAPYFRVFNPITQSQKFDPHGDYISKWVPELSRLPVKFIHTPWEAPEQILKQAGISLGQNYPAPIVDHKIAREAALAAYQAIRT